MTQGMKRDTALAIAGVTRHQLYHRPKTGKAGRPVRHTTTRLAQDGSKVPMPDAQVVADMRALKADLPPTTATRRPPGC
jgi:hypothetical protein